MKGVKRLCVGLFGAISCAMLCQSAGGCPVLAPSAMAQTKPRIGAVPSVDNSLFGLPKGKEISDSAIVDDAARAAAAKQALRKKAEAEATASAQAEQLRRQQSRSSAYKKAQRDKDVWVSRSTHEEQPLADILSELGGGSSREAGVTGSGVLKGIKNSLGSASRWNLFGSQEELDEFYRSAKLDPNELIVLGSDDCVRCKELAKMLSDRKIPFTKLDATEPGGAGKKFLELSGLTTLPVKIRNGQVLR